MCHPLCVPTSSLRVSGASGTEAVTPPHSSASHVMSVLVASPRSIRPRQHIPTPSLQGPKQSLIEAVTCHVTARAFVRGRPSCFTPQHTPSPTHPYPVPTRPLAVSYRGGSHTSRRVASCQHVMKVLVLHRSIRPHQHNPTLSPSCPYKGSSRLWCGELCGAGRLHTRTTPGHVMSLPRSGSTLSSVTMVAVHGAGGICARHQDVQSAQVWMLRWPAPKEWGDSRIRAGYPLSRPLR
jgi:hypothetical protein